MRDGNERAQKNKKKDCGQRAAEDNLRVGGAPTKVGGDVINRKGNGDPNKGEVPNWIKQKKKKIHPNTGIQEHLGAAQARCG